MILIITELVYFFGETFTPEPFIPPDHFLPSQG